MIELKLRPSKLQVEIDKRDPFAPLVDLHQQKIRAQRRLIAVDDKLKPLLSLTPSMPKQDVLEQVTVLTLEQGEAKREFQTVALALHKKLAPYWKHAAHPSRYRIARALYPNLTEFQAPWLEAVQKSFNGVKSDTDRFGFMSEPFPAIPTDPLSMLATAAAKKNPRDEDQAAPPAKKQKPSIVRQSLAELGDK